MRRRGMMKVASGPVPTVLFTGTRNNDSRQTSYSFTGAPIGPADPNRLVIVKAAGTRIFSRTFNTVTIGGVTADEAVANDNSQLPCGIWYANVPSGETANISLSLSGNIDWCHVTIWAAYNLSSFTPVIGTGAGGGGSIDTITLTGAQNGDVGVLGQTFEGGSSTVSGAGFSEDFDSELGYSAFTTWYNSGATANPISGTSVTVNRPTANASLVAVWR